VVVSGTGRGTRGAGEGEALEEESDGAATVSSGGELALDGWTEAGADDAGKRQGAGCVAGRGGRCLVEGRTWS
jgi:hypothetical protein